MRTFVGVTMPFGVQSRDYASMCRFQNSIEDAFGVKMLSIKPLDHHRPGLTLEMAGKNCSYALQWENGVVTLGRFYGGRRERLFQASPSIPSEWDRLVDVVRCSEGRIKAEASRMINPRITIDVAEIKRKYVPKLSIQRRLRM